MNYTSTILLCCGKNMSMISARNLTKSFYFLETTVIYYQILSQWTMKWENINFFFKLSLFCLLFFFSFFFYFFASLHHIMALSNDKTSCTLLHVFLLQPLFARSVHVYMEVWPTPELLGRLNFWFLFSTSSNLPE